MPYNYTNLVVPIDESRAWLQEAQKRGVKTIAILQQTHPGFVAIMSAFLPQVEKYGIKVVFNESFNGTDRDFNSLISKAKLTKPDLYFVGAFPPSLDIIMQEMNSVGIKNISGMGTFTTSPSPQLFNGTWFSDATLTDIGFMNRFKTEYPNERFNSRTVPYGYDIFNMLVKSFEKDGDTNANLKAITEYDGKVGKITKDAESQNFRSQASIWTMEGGEPIMLK